MGAYLSEPNVEKISDDGSCDELSYGASAMQGWRVGMEDAHNCITKLTDDTSLFAVYDGHGGAEVAVYTAQQLPKLLTSLKAFKDGDIDAALEEAFMTFDASLKQKAIIEKLKRIAGMEESEQKEEDGETEALLEEAELPLEELVARYCSHPSKTKRAKLKQSHSTDLLSPMIQKKQPRFPLTAVNGSLQDGDGPVPNKTVPFDEEGDIVTKGESDDDEEEETSINGPGGDSNRNENGRDNDEEGSKVKKEEDGGGDAAPKNGDGSKEEEAKEEAGNSGSQNGDVHSDTKEAGSSSGSSSDSKPKLAVPPYLNDDDDDDSDEEDADYQSGDDDEEEDDEDDEDEDEMDDDEDEEEEGGNDDSGEYEDEEDEEDEYRMQLSGGAKEEPGSDSGSTAVVALLRGKTLTVANIGDSRCVLSREGKALDMSYDHKPEDDLELRRIEKAGGKVTPDGRVNGGLNLSRAFGDHCYKMTTLLPPEEQMISAFPDIQTVTLTDKDDFMVVACDGIWNAMTSQEVIDFVKHRLEKSKDSDQTNQLSKICEELFDFCLAPDTSGDGTGCDNMTCVIVKFQNDGADAISGASVGSKRKSADDDKTEETESKKPRH